ncbi:conserved membrane protein of unknown function [Georgfuchsia toluolica]|uniref:Transmembrane protein n=1 Tax=Georgfuchsia toluolica TaxID=424218 RepID=A0A916J665_9PROT|nr:BPSS1780 family membrane protein [Georgfuchsia toluolica]CAG4884173.1 conserved membrane protein of unknown function [Georgfuchsia toluolica]
MTTYDVHPEPHIVDSSQATAWLSGGWKLFMAAPAVWIAIGVVFAVIHVLLGLVPALGIVAHMLLLPVLAAGLLEASRIAESGAVPPFEALFAGFRHCTGNLVMVGLLTLGALAAIGAIAFVIVFIGGGTGAFSALMHIADADAAATTSGASIGLALGSILLAFLVTLSLLPPLIMALWFAPALVFFDGMMPLAAMKNSLKACLHNWLSITIYGILAFVLMCIVAITVVGLLVVVPLVATSLYLSYRDIFH